MRIDLSPLYRSTVGFDRLGRTALDGKLGFGLACDFALTGLPALQRTAAARIAALAFARPDALPFALRRARRARHRPAERRKSERRKRLPSVHRRSGAPGQVDDAGIHRALV